MPVTVLPQIPDVPADISARQKGFVASLKEIIEVREGRRGDRLDRFVSYRELLEDLHSDATVISYLSAYHGHNADHISAGTFGAWSGATSGDYIFPERLGIGPDPFNFIPGYLDTRLCISGTFPTIQIADSQYYPTHLPGIQITHWNTDCEWFSMGGYYETGTGWKSSATNWPTTWIFYRSQDYLRLYTGKAAYSYTVTVLPAISLLSEGAAYGTKVGIGTNYVPKNYLGAAKLAMDGRDGSYGYGPHIQITTSADDYPLVQMLNLVHDGIYLTFDGYYDGAWRQSDTSVYQIAKSGDALIFRGWYWPDPPGTNFGFNAVNFALKRGGRMVEAWAPFINFGDYSSGYAALQIFGSPGSGTSNDNCGLVFDAHWEGTAWESSDNSMFRLWKLTDVLRIDYDVKPGATYVTTWPNAPAFAVTSTGKVGFGTEAIPHGGIGSAQVAIDGANPFVQFTDSDIGDYPLFGIYPRHVNEGYLAWGGYYDGSDWHYNSDDWQAAYRMYESTGTFRIEAAYALYHVAGDQIAAWYPAFTISNTWDSSTAVYGFNVSNPPRCWPGQRYIVAEFYGPQAQNQIIMSTPEDTYPNISIFGYGHDYTGIVFDALFGGAWYSSDAGSNFFLLKTSDTLRVLYSSGNTQATTFTWNTIPALTITATGKTGFGTDTIPHGGVGKALIAIDGVAGSWDTIPVIQITTSTDNYPIHQAWFTAHHSWGYAWDSYYDGSQWVSSDGEAYNGINLLIQRNTEYLLFYNAHQVTAGSAITWNNFGGIWLDTDYPYLAWKGALYLGYNYALARQTIGAINLSGNPNTGVSQGSSIVFGIAGDYDGTFEYWAMTTEEDDIWLFNSHPYWKFLFSMENYLWISSVGGDPRIIFAPRYDGGNGWGMGNDISDSYSFKISSGGNLGTNDAFTITLDRYNCTINTEMVTIGSRAAGINYALLFYGETSDGTITYMEDELYFQFSKGVVISSATAMGLTIGTGVADRDYQLVFDGDSNDGIITWMEDEATFLFDSRIKVSISNDDTIDTVALFEAIFANTGEDVEDIWGFKALISCSAETITGPAGVRVDIQQSGTGDILDACLFRGSYSGTMTGPKWGLYLTGCTQSTIDGNLTLGTGAAGVDYTLTFDGESSDGVITWMEDEGVFTMACGLSVLASAANALTLGNGAAGIDYYLKFDGETTDGLLYWMEDEGVFRFDHSIEMDVASGDVALVFDTASSDKFCMGVDSSDSYRFKISASGVPGTTDVMSIASTAEIGIGIQPSTNHLLKLQHDKTNLQNKAIYVGMKPHSTASSDHSTYVMEFSLAPLVDATYTMSGGYIGIIGTVLRNYLTASDYDDGSLAAIYGMYLTFGHGNNNLSAVPTTTNVYGIYLKPYASKGTITDLYDIYVADRTAGATITNNHWGLYILGTAKLNYIQNNLLIGGTSSMTSLAKGLVLAQGTAPTAILANAAGLWVEDVNGTAGASGLHMMAEESTDKLIVVGVVVKGTTGDPSGVHEGKMCINTYDNNVKIYGDSGWRTLVTW